MLKLSVHQFSFHSETRFKAELFLIYLKLIINSMVVRFVFYISNVLLDGQYSVLDTEDLTEETVSAETLAELSQKGIEIKGYRESGKSYALSMIDDKLVPHFNYVEDADVPDYITTKRKAIGNPFLLMYLLSDDCSTIERGFTQKQELTQSGLISTYYRGTSAKSQSKLLLGARDFRGTVYDTAIALTVSLASPSFVRSRVMLSALTRQSERCGKDKRDKIIEVTEEELFRLIDLQLLAESEGTTTEANAHGYQIKGCPFTFFLGTEKTYAVFVSSKTGKDILTGRFAFDRLYVTQDSDFNVFFTEEPIPELVVIQKYFLREFMFYTRLRYLRYRTYDLSAEEKLTELSPRSFLACPVQNNISRQYAEAYSMCATTLRVRFEKDDCFVDVAQATGGVTSDSLITLINNPVDYNEVYEKDGYFYVNTLEGLVAIDMASYRAFYGFEDNSRIKKYKLRQMLSGAGGLVEVHENGVCSKCHTAENGDCTIPVMATELSKEALFFEGTTVENELYKGEYSVFLTIPKSLTKLHKDCVLPSYSKGYTVYIRGEISSPEFAKQLIPIINGLAKHCILDVRDKDSLVNLLYGCIANDCELWNWKDTSYSPDVEIDSKEVTTCKAVLYATRKVDTSKHLRYFKSKMRFATDETNALLDNDVITRAINLFLRLELKNFKFLNSAPKLSIRSQVINAIDANGRYAVRLTTWKKYYEKVTLLAYTTPQFGYYLRAEQLAKIDDYCYTALRRFTDAGKALLEMGYSTLLTDKELVVKANKILENWYNSL